VDDNITLNVRRFEALRRTIIDAGLNDLEYTVQAMTSAIANHGERLARLMREVGFR
jgi:anaerobic magnesium-protoporphyrin IX monomethyl ester cyclase